MLYLVTGLPGSSKTLNTIKFIAENENWKDRKIYQYNIKELIFDWEILDTDTAKCWFDLPDNSLIVLDECQSIFPPRRVGSEIPKLVSELNTHRHRGFDIVLITQHPMLLDTAVRRVIGHHTHYERAFGLHRVRRVEWQECINDPKDYHARKDAVISSISIDKKYFDKYKSAEVHTHKSKLPKKLLIIIISAVLIVAGFIWFIYDFSHRSDAIKEEKSLKELMTDPVFSDDPLPHEVDLAYLSNITPRVEGMPWSAPIYDDLNVPSIMPKPSCIEFVEAKDCRCYTQQATRYDVSYELCHSIVQNGWFDYTEEGGNDNYTDASEKASTPRRVTSIDDSSTIQHDFRPR